MAITYTGTKTQTGEYAEIVQEIYADSPTFRGETIEVVEGHKSGMDIYESSADVTFTAANYGPVTADNVALKMAEEMKKGIKSDEAPKKSYEEMSNKEKALYNRGKL